MMHRNDRLTIGGITETPKPYLSAIPQPQLKSLSLAFVRINGQAAGIAIIFFGFETLLRGGGWLIKFEFLPRFLGVLSMVGGIG